MADNSARIPTSQIHNRPTVASAVTSDAIRDLLLGPQTVPPPENSFEPQPLGESRVSMGDHSNTTDRPDPPAGLGTAANSADQAPMEQPGLTTPRMSEAMMKLATFWHDENADINSMDASHEIWRSPEMPLARIKKIMRIDEDVKMISAEVPILFSKAASIFIRELTLRAWIQTEEASRRTLQRSDIALAITKYDMFDFLIDIVPRDEIQVKPTKKQEEGHPALTPEQAQILLQLSQSQHQGQVAATVQNTTQEDSQQSSAQQALLTSPSKASLETLHQLLQLQMLQQQLNATTAQPHSTEQTDHESA